MAVSWLQSWFGETHQTHIHAVEREVPLPDMGPVVVKRTLDCLGAGCPRPQLLTMKVLEQLEDGDVIELLSDNPATVETLPALMFAACGTHLITVREADHWRVYMRKGL